MKKMVYGCVGFNDDEYDTQRLHLIEDKMNKYIEKAPIIKREDGYYEGLKEIDILVVPYQPTKMPLFSLTYFKPEDKKAIHDFLKTGKRKIIFFNTYAISDKMTPENMVVECCSNIEVNDYKKADKEYYRKQIFEELEIPENELKYEDCETCFIAMHYTPPGKTTPTSNYRFEERAAPDQWSRFNKIINNSQNIQSQKELVVELDNSQVVQKNTNLIAKTSPLNTTVPKIKKDGPTISQLQTETSVTSPQDNTQTWHVFGGALIAGALGLFGFALKNSTKYKGETALHTIRNLAHQFVSNAKNTPGNFLLKSGLAITVGVLAGHSVKSFSESQHNNVS